MLRIRVVVVLAFLYAAGVALQPAQAGISPKAPAGLSNIQHIVFIVQENRSFDNYFGTYPGADGFPSPLPCLPSNWYPSQCFSPYLEHKANQLGGPYSSSYQEQDIDGGAMDGFIEAREKELRHSKCNPANQARGIRVANPEVVIDDDEVGPQIAHCTQDVMSYHDGTDLANYWAYAQNYVLMDHFFESVHSQSHPSHLEIFSGWAAKCKQLDPPDVDSCFSDANPGQIWGDRFPEPYLWTDITYLLYQNNVTWKAYLDGGLGPLHDHATVGALWDVLPGFETVQEDGQVANAEINMTEFYSDAANGTLPQVSWLLPHYNDSEHPQANIYQGQSYVTGLINAIMNGPDWSSTAIFVVWDDIGGFYDHQAPPFRFDVLGLGIRVPSLLISPYAQAGLIDHQVCSTDCYLKFIEDVFLNGERMSQSGRPDPRPDYRDEESDYGDLINDFNFNQAPRNPMVLSTHPMTLLH
jgi:phospholipase C